MRTFAITYPQLMQQAQNQCRDAAELEVLKSAHDLAEAMSDGLYRSAGVPFLNHLVRTASITLADRHPIVVVQAALVHAAGFLHGFEDSRRRPPDRSRRRAVREVLGGDVAKLVFEGYARMPWRSPEDRQTHVQRLASYDELARDAIAIRLANELEDFLDGAMAYSGRYLDPALVEQRSTQCVHLANGLRLHDLSADLSAAYAKHTALRVDRALCSEHRTGYERPRTHLWEIEGSSPRGESNP